MGFFVCLTYIYATYTLLILALSNFFMKITLPQLQYNRLLAVYRKLNKRLQKHFAAGSFHQFSKEQQQLLLNRIERLKAQLSLLEKRLKLAGAALLVGTILTTNEANAQFATSGANFIVNTDINTTTNHGFPSVAADSAGDFVVTWARNYQNGRNWGIYAQRYNAAGAAQGSEFLVDTNTAISSSISKVAMDHSGDFVIMWVTSYGGGSYGSYNIFAKRYNAAGIAQGSEFLVATTTGGYLNQAPPSVAMDANGDFVITWQRYNDTDSTSNYDIYAKRYNAAGVAQDTSFLVNTYTTSDQQNPTVAMDSRGDFIITWQSRGVTGKYDIYARRYDSSGTAEGSEFLVNTYTTDQQIKPSAAIVG